MKPLQKIIPLQEIRSKFSSIIRDFDDYSAVINGKTVPLNEVLAILTHYTQNQGTGLHAPYQDKTINIISEILSIDSGLNNNLTCVSEENIQYSLFPEFVNTLFPSKPNPTFTFIDLFAGIGGFRLAMQNIGGKCVFSSEIDADAQKTYFKNFGEVPFGDITDSQIKSFIPKGFDILCAGFPCQSFSIAGYRKGFEDTRGTLFFDIAEIIQNKRPKVIFLENVKNLQSHDNGKTFSTIKTILEKLGYVVYSKVMNASEYGNTPQNRERIFIVCFDPSQVNNHTGFIFPDKITLTKSIHDCIDPLVDDKTYFYTEKMSHFDELKSNITNPNSIYQWRRQYVRENKKHLCPTLTANMGTGGHNVPLINTSNGIRKLTPKECLNFQGYPEQFSFPESISNSAKYKQAGNSVVVPLIQRICQNIIAVI